MSAFATKWCFFPVIFISFLFVDFTSFGDSFYHDPINPAIHDYMISQPSSWENSYGADNAMALIDDILTKDPDARYNQALNLAREALLYMNMQGLLSPEDQLVLRSILDGDCKIVLSAKRAVFSTHQGIIRVENPEIIDNLIYAVGGDQGVVELSPFHGGRDPFGDLFPGGGDFGDLPGIMPDTPDDTGDDGPVINPGDPGGTPPAGGSGNMDQQEVILQAHGAGQTQFQLQSLGSGQSAVILQSAYGSSGSSGGDIPGGGPGGDIPYGDNDQDNGDDDNDEYGQPWGAENMGLAVPLPDLFGQNPK